MVRRCFFSAVSNHGPRGRPSRRAPCEAWCAPQDEGFVWNYICNSEKNQYFTRLFLISFSEPSRKTGKAYLSTTPSKKSIKRICDAISAETGRHMKTISAEKLVKRLNL
jgi:hypothetical protein